LSILISHFKVYSYFTATHESCTRFFTLKLTTFLNNTEQTSIAIKDVQNGHIVVDSEA